MSAAYDNELLIVRANVLCTTIDRVLEEDGIDPKLSAELNALKAQCALVIGRMANA